MTTFETFKAGYAFGKMMQITTHIEWVAIGIIIAFAVRVMWYLVKYTIIYDNMNDDLH